MTELKCAADDYIDTVFTLQLQANIMSKLTLELPDGKTLKYTHSSGLTYNEIVLGFVPDQDMTAQNERIKNLHIRDDDVYLVTYPKCGTHWVWEIISMLIAGSSEYLTNTKEAAFLDFQLPEMTEAIPSRRILNCHFPFKLTPREVFEKGIKIVHVMRNPKDAFVSFYHHMKTIGGDRFNQTFHEFLPQMLGEHGFYMHYPWFRYVKEWEKFSKENPEQILNLYFEDLKENSVLEIKKINKFLGTGRSDDLIEMIADACTFQKLKRADAEVKVFPDFMLHAGRPCFYRKGEVGDWKNYFTDAENENMDTWLAENLIDTDLKFRYTL
ncbi:sulfotransferase 1B1-like isoform X2 [Ruditapes philippinarum]|uniref:sulfotransferase 1B1-like isoform X2 n=1 Tax=Ruditapes philippinarum TaxID=129788 RepID=UPI00295AEE90|nr:sulfotransferase 1B1-like isoform X2 [Ruditapes philippinarum]